KARCDARDAEPEPAGVGKDDDPERRVEPVVVGGEVEGNADGIGLTEAWPRVVATRRRAGRERSGGRHPHQRQTPDGHAPPTDRTCRGAHRAPPASPSGRGHHDIRLRMWSRTPTYALVCQVIRSGARPYDGCQRRSSVTG